MVNIARKNVNIVTYASDNLPRAAFSAASHILAIIMPITMMQTMTSMMITMPLRGSR
jgi:hypothetical protein